MSTTTAMTTYRVRLADLLDDASTALDPDQLAALRTSVHERRVRQRGHEVGRVPVRLAGRVEEIVGLLDDAARTLRPRETQELDDLVAGKAPIEQEPLPRSAKRRGRGTMRAL